MSYPFKQTDVPDWDLILFFLKILSYIYSM